MTKIIINSSSFENQIQIISKYLNYNDQLELSKLFKNIDFKFYDNEVIISKGQPIPLNTETLLFDNSFDIIPEDFLKIHGLKNVILNDNLKFLDRNGFNENIEFVYIPKCEISKYGVFHFCRNLVKISLADGIELPWECFYNSQKLKIVEGNIKKIGKKCFKYCTELERINGTIEEIDDKAFEYCTKLKYLDLSQCKLIGDYTFYDYCYNIVDTFEINPNLKSKNNKNVVYGFPKQINNLIMYNVKKVITTKEEYHFFIFSVLTDSLRFEFKRVKTLILRNSKDVIFEGIKPNVIFE